MSIGLNWLLSRRFAAICLLLAMIIALAGFSILADLSQWIIQVPRRVTIVTFGIRFELMFTGIVMMVAGYWIARRSQFFSRRFLNWWAGIFIFLFVSGYLNATYFMFPSQQYSARFVSIEAISNSPVVALSDTDEMFVVEINGDARAYPLEWMMRPHIAGDIIGGEEVALTYCSLSHLGMAVTPELNGEKLKLRLMTQLQNNLVMFDAVTEKPIQQIWARFEGEQERMKEWPTRIMSFAAFRELYPDGLVLFNPAFNPWDKLVRWMVYTVVSYQHAIEAPVFPTIEQFDTRLPNKAYVYGLRFGGQQLAVTPDYIRKQGGVINIEVGGTPIVLAWFDNFGYADAFYRSIDGEVIDVTAIDPYGMTESGQLERAVMANEVFWFVWSTFYPDTSLLDN